MKNLNFFKKLKLFFEYRKALNIIKKDLQLNLNARVDMISRIYTVLNLPADVIEEPYNLRKSDIDALAQTFIKQYTSDIGKFLNEKGISEFVEFYEIKKVDKYSYLLVFGFSVFNSKKIANRFTYSLITLILLVGLFLLIH